MKKMYWSVFLLITITCSQKRNNGYEKGDFSQISLIEYKFQLNDKAKKYDLKVKSFYQINPDYKIIAYNFEKGNTAVYKTKPELRKEIYHLITKFRSDTIIPFGEPISLYHGPEYLFVKEFNIGDRKVIDFSPVRKNKDLENFMAVLQTDDYKILVNGIDDTINEILLDKKYEMIIEQKFGLPNYPVVSEIKWSKPIKK